MAMLIFYALTYTKIYCCLTRHLNVDMTLGSAIAGGEPNWALAGVGAGLVVISIPFSGKYSKQAKEAVSIHNETFDGISRLNFDIGLFNKGLGLKISL